MTDIPVIPPVGTYVMDITKMSVLDEGLVVRVETNDDDEVKFYLSKHLCVRMTHAQFNSIKQFFEKHK